MQTYALIVLTIFYFALAFLLIVKRNQLFKKDIKYELIDGTTLDTATKVINQLRELNVECEISKVNNKFYITIHNVYREGTEYVFNLGLFLGSIESKLLNK